jgi:hypothetical protein
MEEGMYHNLQVSWLVILRTVFDAALLPPPFLTSQRRARAHSQAAPPRVPLSPQILRTPGRRTLAVLNTPPPRLSTDRFASKGCLTDPPHPRRRPSFNHVRFSLLMHTPLAKSYTPVHYRPV